MATIRRRGYLSLATAAVCVVLLSATGKIEAETVSDGITALRRGNVASVSTEDAVAKLRGSQRILISTDRNLKDDEGEGEGDGEGEEGEQNNEQQKEEQEEQKYEEGNGNDDEEVEEEADQEEEQEVEEEYEEYVEEEDYGDAGDEENGDDDGSNMVNNVKETVADARAEFEILMDRFDEDIAQMWSTSPSEWDGEFWKVFGITTGVFTILLSCVLYLFCVCCSPAQDEDMMGHPGTSKRARKNHRGRLFTRDRTNDTDTVGTNHTGNSTRFDRPFVLIEDIEKDDDKSKLLSPISSKSDTGRDYSVSTRPNIDDETHVSKGTYQTSEAKKSLKGTPRGGIFNETLDVWSEFLGFKNSKYNVKPSTMSNDEDDDIDLTDDEALRRKKRSSSSKKSNGGEKAPTQMKTGTYVRPTEECELDQTVSKSSSNSAKSTASDDERIYVKTPVMSNLMSHNESRQSKANSPRRTALIKTKNLLKSFGNNGSKNKGRNSKTNLIDSDPKEESLLND